MYYGRLVFECLNANAYATAGTSSSSLKIGGSGPTGVMLNLLIYDISISNQQKLQILPYLSVALGIMVLDMREFCGLLERRNVPVQISQPFMDARVSAADVSDVGLRDN